VPCERQEAGQQRKGEKKGTDIRERMPMNVAGSGQKVDHQQQEHERQAPLLGPETEEWMESIPCALFAF